MTRRRTLFALLAFLILTVGPVFAGTRVSGHVFVDANKNGLLDQGEKGLAQVPVTDSLKFVLTDESGRYEMDADVDTQVPGARPILSVTFPTGWWPSTDWFRRLDEAKDLLAVDFGLIEKPTALPFVFAHGSDSHVPRAGRTYVQEFKSEIAQVADRVAFCVLTGDLVDHSDSEPPDRAKAQWADFSSQTQDFPVPLFVTVGNHDVAGMKARSQWQPEDPSYGYGSFTRLMGPLRWSFNFAGVHLVGVNFGRDTGTIWDYGVPASAADWLEKDLAMAPAGSRVLLFVHYPKGEGAWQGILKSGRIEHVFAGHTHDHTFFDAEGTRAVTVQSLAETDDEFEPGYEFVAVTADSVEVFNKPRGMDHAVTIEYPRRESVLRPGEKIRAGFYDPSESVTDVSVILGDKTIHPSISRQALWGSFEVDPGLQDIVEGVQPFEIQVSDGRSSWGSERSCLVLSGNEAGFRARRAILRIDAVGVDVEAEVVFNGQPLGKLGRTEVSGDGPFKEPIQGATRFKLAVPKELLRKLNQVTLETETVAGGKKDKVAVVDLSLRVGWKTFRDFRAVGGDILPDEVSGSESFWIDVTSDLSNTQKGRPGLDRLP